MRLGEVRSRQHQSTGQQPASIGDLKHDVLPLDVQMHHLSWLEPSPPEAPPGASLNQRTHKNISMCHVCKDCMISGFFELNSGSMSQDGESRLPLWNKTSSINAQNWPCPASPVDMCQGQQDLRMGWNPKSR